MRSLITAAALTMAAATATAAYAVGTPTFTVKCMHTGGPKLLPKYGTYYFFLDDRQVKGYGCAVPGRPCLIVRQTPTEIEFQTPGDSPDTIVINLRDGSIRHTTTTGEQATFACRQVPNNS